MSDEAERQFDLGVVAMRSLDVDAAAAHLSAAVREFTRAGDSRRAAMASAQLSQLYSSFMGNLTAGRAWFARATRLLADEPPCVEQGWVALACMGCEVDDPDDLLARADLALDRARRFGDLNLEMKALADGGLAHVQAGRIADGMGMMDEAMALVCGPTDDLDAQRRSVCSFFTACYYAADYARAAEWGELLKRRDVIGPRPPAVFLSSHCDSVQGTMLCELGRWGEAEALLTHAIRAFEACMPIPDWHAAIALADLRIRQGRLAEAEALLLGKEGHVQALLPAARLHLARGDFELARVTAGRGLRAIGTDRVRAVELLRVLVDAELGRGDLGAARCAADELATRADDLDVPSIRVRAAGARARVAAAENDVRAAVSLLESESDTADGSTPTVRAALLIELARLHERADDLTPARLAAKAASELLAGLDLVVETDDRLLLDRLGAPIGADATKGSSCTVTLSREGKWWSATDGSTVVRIPHTKGLAYLATLIAAPGIERHALDLVDAVEGVGIGDGRIDRRALGDAGELLDGRARTAYRHRIEELRSAVDEALIAGREDRAIELQTELDELVGQLAAAFGIGGRGRRAASAVERARLNVTRALRAATSKLDDALPGAGSALDRRLRTGTYCAYEPQDGDETRWIVQS